MKNCTKHRHRNFSREQQKQHDFPCDHLPPKIRVDYLKHSKFMVFIFAQFQVLCLHRFAIKNSSIHVFSCKKTQKNQPTSTGKNTLASQHLWLGKLEGWVPRRRWLLPGLRSGIVVVPYSFDALLRPQRRQCFVSGGIFWGWDWYPIASIRRVYFELSPGPNNSHQWDDYFLGDPYKPSFATVTGIFTYLDLLMGWKIGS